MAVGKILFLIASIGAFIFLAAGTGGNSWRKSTQVDSQTGLWKACILDICNDVGDFLSEKDWFRATRAFSVIACLLSVPAVLVAIISLFSDKIKALIGAILLFCAAACMVIALAIYTDKHPYNKDYTKYGWSYILGWIGALASVGAGIVGVLVERC